jgi:hypothetical protein
MVGEGGPQRAGFRKLSFPFLFGVSRNCATPGRPRTCATAQTFALDSGGGACDVAAVHGCVEWCTPWRSRVSPSRCSRGRPWCVSGPPVDCGSLRSQHDLRHLGSPTQDLTYSRGSTRIGLFISSGKEAWSSSCRPRQPSCHKAHCRFLKLFDKMPPSPRLRRGKPSCPLLVLS